MQNGSVNKTAIPISLPVPPPRGQASMHPADLLSLLALAGIWGSSYLFMRLGAPEFGAWPLAAARAGGAALVLLPWMVRAGAWPALRRGWARVALVGLTQSALPFVCFSFAATRLPSGLSAVLGATTPLFTALVARVWLGERFTAARMTGLVAGLAGVGVVASGHRGVAGGAGDAWLAIVACLVAALGYAFSATYTRRRVSDVPSIGIAAGSQVMAALVLAPLGLASWPAAVPGLRAWLALVALAVLCTAIAYAVFFRLLARIGASRTTTVTFLIPVFGVVWGWVFLDERISAGLVGGCSIVLLGTALTTGVIGFPKLRKSLVASAPAIGRIGIGKS